MGLSNALPCGWPTIRGDTVIFYAFLLLLMLIAIVLKHGSMVPLRIASTKHQQLASSKSSPNCERPSLDSPPPWWLTPLTRTADSGSIVMIYHNCRHYCSQVKICLSVDSCRVDTRALPRWLPHLGGWLPSLGDSSSTAMAVRLVSVLHFYPLFSCEEIPFVFAKHVLMEMIVSVVWLYV